MSLDTHEPGFTSDTASYFPRYHRLPPQSFFYHNCLAPHHCDACIILHPLACRVSGISRLGRDLQLDENDQWGTIEAGLGQGQIDDDFSISPSSCVSATLSTYYGKTLRHDSTVRDKRPSPVPSSDTPSASCPFVKPFRDTSFRDPWLPWRILATARAHRARRSLLS